MVRRFLSLWPTDSVLPFLTALKRALRCLVIDESGQRHMNHFRYMALPNMAFKAFGFQRQKSEAAFRVEVLQSEEIDENPALLCLPGQLEKAVRGVSGHSSLEEELHIERRSHVVHAPVIRYTLRNCLVHRHGVEFLGGSVRKSGGLMQRIPKGPVKEVAKAAYCMAPVTHRYFGHWLRDACSTALLARVDEAVCLDLRSDWAHADAYVRAFSIRPQQDDNLFVRELTLFQDHSQGSSKRERYAELRACAATFYGDALSPAKPVYLRRGHLGQPRSLSNEDELIQCLEQRGFLVLDASKSSAADLFRCIAAARLVIAMEGSHLNHVHFSMAQGGSLLALIPSDRFTLMHLDFAHAFGLKFAALVVERDEAGYRVDMDALLRTMELLPL